MSFLKKGHKKEKEHPFPEYVGFMGFVIRCLLANQKKKPYFGLPKGYTSAEVRDEINAMIAEGKNFSQILRSLLLPDFALVMISTFANVFFKYTSLLILWLFLVKYLYTPGAELYLGYMLPGVVVPSIFLGGAFEIWKIWGIYRFGQRLKVINCLIYHFIFSRFSCRFLRVLLFFCFLIIDLGRFFSWNLFSDSEELS